MAGLGCEFGQGYWLGRPVDMHAAASLLLQLGAHATPRAQRKELSGEALPDTAPVH